MTPAERQELLQCSRRIAALLYQEACEQNEPMANLGAIESTVRSQVQDHVTPVIGEFFGQTVTGTDAGYPRQLESILGQLSLSSEQARQLGVRPRQQISPYLELCCLRQSAIVSYAQAATEVEVQTGRRVSAKTQQRLEERHVFAVPASEVPVEQMSLDGGMIRLRTPLGEAAEWREYKALNLGEQHQGMAWFKDNEHLIEWANGLPLAPIVNCLGDGHDGVWGVYAQIGRDPQRHEILDWFHLMENLHQVQAATELLETVRGFLWQGQVDAAMNALNEADSVAAKRFCGYLERHRERIPNYRYYQEEGWPIGSGDVESWVKQINQRTKIPGASWKAERVPQVLAHRCAYLNGMLSPHQYFST
ncbi:MAG: ISKra4 family transposase [Cyanobacteria bacterium P01_C01_bin.120]